MHQGRAHEKSNYKAPWIRKGSNQALCSNARNNLGSIPSRSSCVSISVGSFCINWVCNLFGSHTECTSPLKIELRVPIQILQAGAPFLVLPVLWCQHSWWAHCLGTNVGNGYPTFVHYSTPSVRNVMQLFSASIGWPMSATSPSITTLLMVWSLQRSRANNSPSTMVTCHKP